MVIFTKKFGTLNPHLPILSAPLRSALLFIVSHIVYHSSVVLWNQKSDSLTDWEWQCHLLSCPGQLKISQGKKDQLHTLSKIIDSECRLLTFYAQDQPGWWDPSRTGPAWTNNTMRIRGGYQRCWFHIEVQFILQIPLNSICIMISP